MNRSERTNISRSLAWLAAGLLASAAGLSPAHAGEQKHPSGSTLQQIDTNQDGRVSRAEAQRDPALAKRFDALDANHDGTLDAAELATQDSQAAAGGTEVKQ